MRFALSGSIEKRVEENAAGISSGQREARAMELGVLIPIGNNGWLISTTSPQYMPSFDLNRQVVEKAERFGFDFALSMIKLHGFGGPSQYWDHNLEIIYLDGGAGGGNHPHSAFRLGRGANSLFHYFQRH
jgi:hypothetical protein